jgi:hypothetical protein
MLSEGEDFGKHIKWKNLQKKLFNCDVLSNQGVNELFRIVVGYLDFGSCKSRERSYNN